MRPVYLIGCYFLLVVAQVNVSKGQLLAPLELRCVDQYGDLSCPTQDLRVSAGWTCPVLSCDVQEFLADADGIIRIAGMNSFLCSSRDFQSTHKLGCYKVLVLLRNTNLLL